MEQQVTIYEAFSGVSMAVVASEAEAISISNIEKRRNLERINNRIVTAMKDKKLRPNQTFKRNEIAAEYIKIIQRMCFSSFRILF